MQELGQISQQLENEPENLRTSILSGMAKLKGLDLLTGVNAFQMDKQRLDAKQRAIYKLQGLDLGNGEETITNILADNITIDNSSRKAAQPQSQPQPVPVQPEPKPDPTPLPPQPPVQPSPAGSFARRFLPWLLAGGLVAGNVGAGAWLLNKIQQPADARMTIGLETE